MPRDKKEDTSDEQIAGRKGYPSRRMWNNSKTASPGMSAGCQCVYALQTG